MLKRNKRKRYLKMPGRIKKCWIRIIFASLYQIGPSGILINIAKYFFEMFFIRYQTPPKPIIKHIVKCCIEKMDKLVNITSRSSNQHMVMVGHQYILWNYGRTFCLGTKKCFYWNFPNLIQRNWKPFLMLWSSGYMIKIFFGTNQIVS